MELADYVLIRTGKSFAEVFGVKPQLAILAQHAANPENVDETVDHEVPMGEPFIEFWDEAALGPEPTEAEVTTALAAPQPRIPPEMVTLSDWRIGLELWGRLDEVKAKVQALVAAGQVMGKIANEQLEYSNTVGRVRLKQLRQAFGFSEADVDESMFRAGQVTLGDFSGHWPPPSA